MGKLGKKARKFAKKNLQSVMKRKRKFNSKIKKKSSSRDEKEIVEDQTGNATELSTGREPLIEDVEDASLDIFTSEEDDDMIEDGSDSEGFLSEDPSCSYAGEGANEVYSEDSTQSSELSRQNHKIQSELSEKKKRLEALQQKDPHFAVFLQNRLKDQLSRQNEEMSDEDEMSDHGLQSVNGSFPSPNSGRLVNESTIKGWCQIIKEQRKLSVFPSLLNAYRAASHYGAESNNANASVSSPIIKNKETFCSIVMFMLSEGDKLFRDLLGLSSNCKTGAIKELKSSSKWENLKPFIKSYLTSTLFLLNQLTDTDILVYSLTRLRASLVFFAAFPSLVDKLAEVAVRLWATGGGALSSCSFLVLHDMASIHGNDCYDKCLKKTYRAIVSHCKVVDPSNLKHVEFLKSSFVELCSIDLQKSVQVAVASTQKMARILQLGLQTNKEALQMICSWEYALCIDLWVTYVSVNIRDNDLHGLLFTIIQVINGVANLFAGHRYLPLKIKCIQWLNHLSSSSGSFIPISSLALDILEGCTTKEVGKSGKGSVNLSTTLKLPKHWLKSREFQEESVFAAVELLAAHFLQWSHYISLPELATIPIMRLKQFHEKSTAESVRRTVKRLIDQVEKNIEFVERKRDEVSFSPKDQASADSFLQMEKQGGNAPFIQYYKSMLQNAMSSKNIVDAETRLPEKKEVRKRKRKAKAGISNGEIKSGKIGVDSAKTQQGVSKKQKT